jgi:hypothetical protein
VRGSAFAAGIALLVFGVAGVAWFALETTAPRLGFEDTDSPAVMLAFLRAHPEVYGQACAVLLVMALALTVAVLAVRDSLAQRERPLALRSATAFGLLSAGCFFLLGVVRGMVGPLLHIDDLDPGWGEAGYIVVQLVGTQLAAQGATLALAIWIAGLAIFGARTRRLPLALCLFAVVPALRIAGALGPLSLGSGVSADGAPEWLWIVFMAAIPGTMLWIVGLGLLLLARGRRLTKERGAS